MSDDIDWLITLVKELSSDSFGHSGVGSVAIVYRDSLHGFNALLVGIPLSIRKAWTGRDDTGLPWDSCDVWNVNPASLGIFPGSECGRWISHSVH